MKDNPLVDLSKQFAVKIVNITTEIRDAKRIAVLTNQLLRCGTSIGANIHEANYAASRADFINKLQIALKESYETDYWLSILKDTGNLPEADYQVLYADCSKLRKLLTASIKTAKYNSQQTYDE